jgi:hypothetical protein
MGNIYVRYKIDDPKPEYTPGMTLSGKVWIESKEAKDKKLKKVLAKVTEYYESYETRKTGKVKKTQWWNVAKVIQKFSIAQKESLAASETKEYNFNIELPSWEPKADKWHRNWFISLHFLQKTGLMATPGARRMDAGFVIPCQGASAPLEVIQNMMGGGSQSNIEGGLESDYAQSVISSAEQRMQQGIGAGTYQRLRGLLPDDDEVIMECLVRVKDEQGSLTEWWDSPVVVSRYGLGIMTPKGPDSLFEFHPYIGIKKLKKNVGGMGIPAGIIVKLKGGLFASKIYSLIRRAGEDKASFKVRKKEFRTTTPQLFKSAKKSKLWAKEASLLMPNAGGTGVQLEPQTSDVEISPEPSQASDADLFPGYSQAPSQAAPISEESFDEDFDWMEESAEPPPPAQPAPPQTDFLPSQPSSTDSGDEDEWDWDEDEV